MFYTTVYIGDLYKRANPLAHGDLDMETLRQNALARDAEATRLGSRALFYTSVITLVLTWLLPAFVATPASERSHSSSRDYRPVSTNATDEFVRGVGDGIESDQEGGADIEDDTRHQHRWRPSVVQHGEDATKWKILGRMFELTIPEKMKIDMATLWAFGHLTFAFCMFGTL
jgi:solute carrier family 45 protein 1/2/4